MRSSFIVCSGNFHDKTRNLRSRSSNTRNLTSSPPSLSKSTQTLWPNRFAPLPQTDFCIPPSLSQRTSYRSILRIALCYVYFSVVGQMIFVTCLSLELEWSEFGLLVRELQLQIQQNTTAGYYDHVLRGEWLINADKCQYK